MRIPVLGLTACLVTVPLASHAVTSITSNRTVSTTVGTTTVTTNPNTQTTLPNSGSISVFANALAQTNLGNGSWQFNGLDLASLVEQRGGSGGNNGTTAAANFTYTIAFNLGVGETANLSLGLGYDILETVQDGTLTWGLVGPSGSIANLSGSRTAPGSDQTVATQQATITAAGNYTFTLTGAMPSQDTRRSQSLTVTLDSLNFQIISVPEPASAALAASGLGLLAFRRRRIPS